MTIVAQQSVLPLSYRGYDNPSLPIGIWEGFGTVVGDGSGGVAEIDLVFNLATASRDPKFYSLDALMWLTSEVVANRTVELFVNNLGDVGGTKRYEMIASRGPDTQALEARAYGILPLFLGRQTNPGVTTFVGTRVTNINLAGYTMFGSGYVWDARSIMAEGGPSRPLQGIFSR